MFLCCVFALFRFYSYVSLGFYYCCRRYLCKPWVNVS